MFDRLMSRLLARPIEEAVRKALAGKPEAVTAEDLLHRYLLFGASERLHIAPSAVVNDALFNVESGHIEIGETAFFGHRVALLTGTHDFTKFGRQRQDAVPKSGRDIVVKEGAWIASHCLVLGPCVIGEHAVVGAGSLVSRDVDPYTVVAGRPAKPVRKLEPPAAESDRLDVRGPAEGDRLDDRGP